MHLLLMIVSSMASFLCTVMLACMWFPRIERLVGFCVVQAGLIVADAGLKLSMCGGRMVDRAKWLQHKPDHVSRDEWEEIREIARSAKVPVGRDCWMVKPDGSISIVVAMVPETSDDQPFECGLKLEDN